MTALILLSHGSRHPRAHHTVAELARQTQKLCPEAGRVEAAHLEFNEPSLAGCADNLSQQGIGQAVVVPLLFTQGYHARVDVPTTVVEVARATGVNLIQAETLGSGPEISQCVAAKANEDAPAGAHVVIAAVGSSDEAANAQIRHLAQSVTELTGRSAEPLFITRGGAQALEAIATRHPRVHVIALFVTHGLLLDMLVGKKELTEQRTGAAITFSSPLGVDLAEVVARRYRASEVA